MEDEYDENKISGEVGEVGGLHGIIYGISTHGGFVSMHSQQYGKVCRSKLERLQKLIYLLTATTALSCDDAEKKCQTAAQKSAMQLCIYQLNYSPSLIGMFDEGSNNFMTRRASKFGDETII